MPNSNGNGTLGKLAGLAGALLAIIIAIAALVGPVRNDLDEHEDLSAHPTSAAWKVAEDQADRTMSRKLDEIDSKVDDIRESQARMETLLGRR